LNLGLDLLRKTFLFGLAIVVGSLFAALATMAWFSGFDPNPKTFPLELFGLALTYVGFGALPALLFGVPPLRFLRRRRYPLGPSLAALTGGGLITGGLLMFATFGSLRVFDSFTQLGAIVGASYGLALGLLLLPRSPSLAAA
jgi:hypothetical protein